GRDLLDAAELRQMAEHTQAVAITGSAPPVRFGFPHCAKGGPLAHPLPREIAQPISLADAEALFANHRAEETETSQDELTTSAASRVSDHDGDCIDKDEEVIPHDPILFPLIEERQFGLSQTAQSVPPNRRRLSPVLSASMRRRWGERDRQNHVANLLLSARL